MLTTSPVSYTHLDVYKRQDYRSYVDCQDKVDELYELQEEWTAKAMLNIANMGYFSSDRTIKEYADHIWHIDPVRL